MLEPWLFDNIRLLSNIAERAWHGSNTEALAMSAGSWSDQALMGLITLSDGRSSAHESLGRISYVYIYVGPCPPLGTSCSTSRYQYRSHTRH